MRALTPGQLVTTDNNRSVTRLLRLPRQRQRLRWHMGKFMGGVYIGVNNVKPRVSEL